MILDPAKVGERLARGRAAAEALMTLTLGPRVPDGFTTTPGGLKVPAFAAGDPSPGKVQGGSQSGRDTTTRYLVIDGVRRPVLEGGLHIPIAAAVPVAGEQRGTAWEYVVEELGPADDPALLGRRYLVVGVPMKSFATARRLDVVEL